MQKNVKDKMRRISQKSKNALWYALGLFPWCTYKSEEEEDSS